MSTAAEAATSGADLGADLPASFRAAFRGHPAGIGLIAAMTASGPVGLTASSVASIGIDPVALTFSVMRSTGSAGAILAADTYVVHLLDSAHVDLAQRFATTGSARFTAGEGWSTLPTGEPHLASARVALRCRSLHIVPVGSASAVIAEVLDIRHGRSTDPVVYQDRSYRALTHPRTA